MNWRLQIKDLEMNILCLKIAAPQQIDACQSPQAQSQPSPTQFQVPTQLNL